MVEREEALEQLHEAAGDLADLGLSEEEFLILARRAFKDIVEERESARGFDSGADYNI